MNKRYIYIVSNADKEGKKKTFHELGRFNINHCPCYGNF